MIAALMLAAAVPGRTPAIGVEVIGTGPGTPPPGDGIGWWDGEFPPLGFEVQPRYTRAGDPDGGVVPAGGPLDGVARLDITWPSATVGCSGALLQTGRHVLTAAHCLTDDAGALNVTSASVTFEGDGGTHSIPATAYAIHPDWDGNVLRGNGVAVVTLAMEAPAEIARYGLYTGTGEVGRLAEHGGLRGFGQGATGADPAAYPFGTKRAGLNVCDSLADLILEAVGFVRGVDFAPGAMLAYDFDNGDPANDAFGYFFGIAETGQGEDEVMSALGGSGGPPGACSQVALPCAPWLTAGECHRLVGLEGAGSGRELGRAVSAWTASVRTAAVPAPRTLSSCLRFALVGLAVRKARRGPKMTAWAGVAGQCWRWGPCSRAGAEGWRSPPRPRRSPTSTSTTTGTRPRR